jgi:hypothetical protein
MVQSKRPRRTGSEKPKPRRKEPPAGQNAEQNIDTDLIALQEALDEIARSDLRMEAVQTLKNGPPHASFSKCAKNRYDVGFQYA